MLSLLGKYLNADCIRLNIQSPSINTANNWEGRESTHLGFRCRWFQSKFVEGHGINSTAESLEDIDGDGELRWNPRRDLVSILVVKRALEVRGCCGTFNDAIEPVLQWPAKVKYFSSITEQVRMYRGGRSWYLIGPWINF